MPTKTSLENPTVSGDVLGSVGVGGKMGCEGEISGLGMGVKTGELCEGVGEDIVIPQSAVMVSFDVCTYFLVSHLPIVLPLSKSCSPVPKLLILFKLRTCYLWFP